MNTIGNNTKHPIQIEVNFGTKEHPECGSTTIKPGQKINLPEENYIIIQEVLIKTK